MFPALGESESSELFNDEPIVGVELSRPQNRVRPPKMIALGATKESITWQLSELDPKIGIEKYQVRSLATLEISILAERFLLLAVVVFLARISKTVSRNCIHKVFLIKS